MISPQDDRILASTRIAAALVVPFLVIAFLILYFFPGRSGDRFAWEIVPNMTASFMGAGYLGGSWLFLNAIFGRRWHRVAPGFLPVTVFAAAMLLVTVLHWTRFDIRHFPFELWLVLYVVTPVLIPWVWIRNRVSDFGAPEEDDVAVPRWARWGLRLLGAVLLGFGVIAFLEPDLLIPVWPWSLTLLTAPFLTGWFALLGVGGLVISLDARWSAWRVGLQSIAIWHVLVLIAAIINRNEFPAGMRNWYLISVALVLVGMAVLYIDMELKRRKQRSADRRAG